MNGVPERTNGRPRGGARPGTGAVLAGALGLLVAGRATADLPRLTLTVPTGIAAEFTCPGVSRTTSATGTTRVSATPTDPYREPAGAPAGVVPFDAPWLHPEAAHPLRIAIWGDSHMAGGAFRQELVRVVEAQSLPVRASSIPINLTQSGVYLPVRAACAPSSEWVLAPAYRAREPVAVGLSLAALRSTRPGSRLLLDLRDGERRRQVDRLSVRYSPAETDVVLGVTSDDGTEQRIRLPARRTASPSLAELLIQAREPLGTLRVRVLQGGFDLQGLLLGPASRQPTVTLDVFGLSSSTVHGWAMADPATLQAALTGLGYDAVILAYGTNEGAAPDFNRARYETDLAQALQVLRQVFPTQPCLLVSPPDRGVLWSRDPSVARTEPYFYARRHRAIASAQAEVGAHYACQVWDWQQAMGGPGSSYGWSQASPAYMQRDLTHLTALGYRWSAQAFARYLHWLP